MANKERYKEVLTRILSDYYNDVKLKKSESKERQQFIDGYMIAARALDIFSFKELKVIVDEIHFKVFGKTIQERRLSEDNNTGQNSNFFNIPTYIR